MWIGSWNHLQLLQIKIHLTHRHFDNHTAIRLYESLGYVFAGDAAPELVGMLELHPDTGGLNQP